MDFWVGSPGLKSKKMAERVERISTVGKGKEFLRICCLFSCKQLLRDYGGVAQAGTKISRFSVVAELQEGYLGEVHLNGVGCLGTASHRSRYSQGV